MYALHGACSLDVTCTLYSSVQCSFNVYKAEKPIDAVLFNNILDLTEPIF